MARFLGIDTSCYTTSVAVYDSAKGLIGEERILLSVKEGQRGLSQSNMVFQHVKNLPIIFNKLSSTINDIQGIGVSAYPRRRADSYMPAFLVGKNFGESLAASFHAPLWHFSHQENHAMAAIRDYPELWGNPFYLLHMSGGTQDVLSCTWHDGIMHIEELFSTSDITAGQLIDRVGVAMGLSFPCGRQLEQLALLSKEPYEIPVSKTKNCFSFAGPETKVQKDIAKGIFAQEDIAKGILVHIGNALDKVLKGYPFTKATPIILVGGVMANQYLRHRIEQISYDLQLKPYFAESKYSSDNASGNAFGAFMRFKDEIV